MDIDVNEHREAAIAFHELDRVDEVYTFYYDETNNIRRLHITHDGLNVKDPGCFVLGGIAHRGEPRDLGFAELLSALKVQKSVKELKLKHIGSGAFLEILLSERLTALLSWIIERDLFIHFQALDVMYWSIVDIVNSILTETRNGALMSIGGELKNDLYIILRANIDHTVDLFKRYSYPNVVSTTANRIRTRIAGYPGATIRPPSGIQPPDAQRPSSDGLGSSLAALSGKRKLQRPD